MNLRSHNSDSSSSDSRRVSPKEDASHRGDDNRDKPPLPRLLVVDDDVDIVQVLKLGLLRNGFSVDAFTNPEEALQSFKSNADSYCLVLSDIRMPGLSGIQLTKRIKAINPMSSLS